MANFAVDPELVQRLINDSVEQVVTESVEQLVKDPAWLKRVENLVNQAVVHQTLRTLGQLDVNSVIKKQVDDTMEVFRSKVGEHFRSTGIADMASSVQLTVMDEATVFENQLTAYNH